MARKPIEAHIRDQLPVPRCSLLLRGSPLTREQLTIDADRTARRFNYAGEPCRGISVELAADDTEVDRLLREGRVRSRERIARIPLADVTQGGFIVLPTFGAPHHTVVVGRDRAATLDRLLELALRDVIENPYYRR